MSDKMDLAKIIEKVVNRLMQEMAYKISDLCESYDSEQIVFFLAAETLHVRAVLPLLDSKDREVYDKLLNASTTAVMPRSMNPRKGRE